MNRRAGTLKSGDNQPFEHFIITRFGIGQRSEAFYQANLPLLQLVLVKSLAAQTNSSFSWIIVVDLQCPDWVLNEISAFGRQFNELIVIVHDPWKSLSMMPNLSEMIGARIPVGTPVLTTRIDHDDAVSISFNETVRSRLDNHAVGDFESVALSYPRGAVYFLRAKIALNILKPDYSVVSMLSRTGIDFKDCYAESHKSFHMGLESRGTLAIDTGQPIWMRLVRPDSSHKLVGKTLTEVADLAPLLRIPHSYLVQVIRRNYPNRYQSILAKGKVRGLFGVEPSDLEGIKPSFHLKLNSPQQETLRRHGINLDGHNQISAKQQLLDSVNRTRRSADMSEVYDEELYEIFYCI